jgi:hypothetical protein
MCRSVAKAVDHVFPQPVAVRRWSGTAGRRWKVRSRPFSSQGESPIIRAYCMMIVMVVIMVYSVMIATCCETPDHWPGSGGSL